MFTNFKQLKISDYVDRKNKSDCIIIYDVDTLKGQKNILIKALNRRNIPYRYFNGQRTDKVFLGVELTNFKNKNSFLKLLKQFRHHTRLTNSEKQELNNIRKGYYLSKKYMDDAPSEDEYGVYEPRNTYSDYWNNKACSEWDTLNKSIKYEKRLIWEVFPEFSHYKRIMYGEE